MWVLLKRRQDHSTLATSKIFLLFTSSNQNTVLLERSNFVTSSRCRLRVVNSFGTDAEFNYHGYKKPIPGGASSWGKLDLDLRQFMTMFRKSCNCILGGQYMHPVSCVINHQSQITKLFSKPCSK